jgi:hypothetical protein
MLGMRGSAARLTTLGALTGVAIAVPRRGAASMLCITTGTFAIARGIARATAIPSTFAGIAGCVPGASLAATILAFATTSTAVAAATAAIVAAVTVAATGAA